MTEQTPLDFAHAAMEAAPQDDAARLRFFERLADSVLFLMLREEAQGENISPETFELADGVFVLVFDSEERLAAFAGRVVPYASVSGRVIAGMLAGQGIGLGVNLDVAPSSILIPSEAIGWLQRTLDHAPDEVEDSFRAFMPPTGIPEPVLSALDAKLASASGLAQAAFLAGVEYAAGGRGHLVGFVGAREGAEGALAKAVGEALTFSGAEAGTLDVAFLAADAQAADRLARVGLRFDLPQPEPPRIHAPKPPGSNPDEPPRLR